MSRLHLEFASEEVILREERVGRYHVQAFRYPHATLDGSRPFVYRVLVEEWPGAWRKVRCWTDEEERRFPKRAAEVGTRLVAELKAEEGRATK